MSQKLIETLDQASAAIAEALSGADLKPPVAEPIVEQVEEAVDRVSAAVMHVVLALGGADLRPPVPRLTTAQVAAIEAQGKLHPWSERARSDRRWPHEWIRDFYGGWIPGLLTSHLSRADPILYGAYMKHVSRKGIPDGLDIPTEPENRLRGIADPGKRLELMTLRKLHARRVRLLRSRPS